MDSTSDFNTMIEEVKNHIIMNVAPKKATYECGDLSYCEIDIAGSGTYTVTGLTARYNKATEFLLREGDYGTLSDVKRFAIHSSMYEQAIDNVDWYDHQIYHDPALPVHYNKGITRDNLAKALKRYNYDKANEFLSTVERAVDYAGKRLKAREDYQVMMFQTTSDEQIRGLVKTLTQIPQHTQKRFAGIHKQRMKVLGLDVPSPSDFKPLLMGMGAAFAQDSLPVSYTPPFCSCTSHSSCCGSNCSSE